jgi:hypothetical protein
MEAVLVTIFTDLQMVFFSYRITFARAKALAAQYKIIDMLYPLFVDDPSVFLYMSPLATGTSASQFPHFAGHYRNHPCLNTFNSSWDRQQYESTRQGKKN